MILSHFPRYRPQGFKHREQHWQSIDIIQILWGTGHHQESNICETDCWLPATISKLIQNCSGTKSFVRPHQSWQTQNPQISSITTTTELTATSSHRVLMVWMCLRREYQHEEHSEIVLHAEPRSSWNVAPSLADGYQKQARKCKVPHG